MIEMMKLAQRVGDPPHGPTLARGFGDVAPPSPSPAEGWCKALTLLALHLPLARRVIAAGRPIQHAGDPFSRLHLVNGGVCKSVRFGGDGRQQIVALHFKGDWIGFDGIADERCATDASSMSDSEIWSMNYAALRKVVAQVPLLARLIAAAMSEQLGRNRTWRHALGTLTAVQRVADFLCGWRNTRQPRALQVDRIVLCMTRAEIGSYLGLTIETVSRAFSQLEHSGLIRILPQGRRHIGIPDAGALGRFAGSAAEQDWPARSRQHSSVAHAERLPLRALAH